MPKSAKVTLHIIFDHFTENWQLKLALLQQQQLHVHNLLQSLLSMQQQQNQFDYHFNGDAAHLLIGARPASD